MYEAARAVDLDNLDQDNLAGEVADFRFVSLYPALDIGLWRGFVDSGFMAQFNK